MLRGGITENVIDDWLSGAAIWCMATTVGGVTGAVGATVVRGGGGEVVLMLLVVDFIVLLLFMGSVEFMVLLIVDFIMVLLVDVPVLALDTLAGGG